eukprot:3901018-Rhodomonas_salina.2
MTYVLSAALHGQPSPDHLVLAGNAGLLQVVSEWLELIRLDLRSASVLGSWARRQLREEHQRNVPPPFLVIDLSESGPEDNLSNMASPPLPVSDLAPSSEAGVSLAGPPTGSQDDSQFGSQDGSQTGSARFGVLGVCVESPPPMPDLSSLPTHVTSSVRRCRKFIT